MVQMRVGIMGVSGFALAEMIDLYDCITLNVPPISLSNVPGISE